MIFFDQPYFFKGFNPEDYELVNVDLEMFENMTSTESKRFSFIQVNIVAVILF